MTPKPLILIVDDEPRNLRIIQQSLGSSYNIKEASSGEAALELLDEEVPDLILLDVMMAGMGGYEVCKNIRKREKFAATKTIFVSGRASDEERLKGYECGGDDYIVKPFNPSELKAKVDVFLRLVEAERKLAALNENLAKQVEIRSYQLLQKERAAYIGIHAAEIVHNLNNPIAIIYGLTLSLMKKYPEEGKLLKSLEAVERLIVITKSILDTVRTNGDNTKGSVDLNAILLSELQLLKIDMFYNAEVILQNELKDIAPVSGVDSHFSQVFGNLIRNAIDSLHGRAKKTLRVATRNEGNFVVVEIEDSGCGIPKEYLEKIFDPFFTTKPAVSESGEPTGTGLGLASTRKMIKSYGAEMLIDSTQGEGTKFTVRIAKKEVT